MDKKINGMGPDLGLVDYGGTDNNLVKLKGHPPSFFIDPDAAPILGILLSGPYDIKGLSELADKRLKPRLERIAGVGSVGLMGDRPREIRVWLDPLRLSGHGLSVDDVE